MKGERTEVRRWKIWRCDCGGVEGLHWQPSRCCDSGLHATEVLEAAPLIESLEQLAGEMERDAAYFAERAENADDRAKRAITHPELGAAGSELAGSAATSAAMLANAVRLRSLIQSLNPQEVDTNAD